MADFGGNCPIGVVTILGFSMAEELNKLMASLHFLETKQE